MVDPLQPFSSIVRTALDRALHRAKSDLATDAKDAAPPHQIKENVPVQSLRSRLRARTAAKADADSVQLRQFFVESVLLSELGEGFAQDPAFGELVQIVSEQLASDPQLSARLEFLLNARDGQSL